jgi:hypothetical protein
MISIYFIINALEAFFLAAYLASVESLSETTVLFNLSLSRLLLVLAVAAAGVVFAFLAFKSRPEDSSIKVKIRAIFNDEKKVWLVFLLSLALIALIYLPLMTQKWKFGNFELIYVRLEPVLVWMAVICAQTAFFSALAYCAKFIDYSRSPEAQLRVSELPALFGVFAAFIALKLLLVTASSYGPLGSGDEMTYFDMADSFHRGFFSIAQSHHYPPLYPLYFMPALVFGSYAFSGIKLLNVLASSSVIFPVYFIARHFMGRKQSLLAVLLTCLIPYHLVFPRRILSENLFFPLFIWTVFITFARPKNTRTRLPWDLLNGAMLAVLYLTRYITLAAIPFFVLAWWVKPFEDEPGLFKPGWKKFGHLAGMGAAVLLAFSPWLIAGLREGVNLKLVLGFGVASKTDPAQLTLYNLVTWMVLYASYYVLVAAPVLNLLLVAFTQVDLKKWREELGRLIFQVLSLMAGFYLAVTRHSWRAYYNREAPSKIMGRYLIVYSLLYIILAVIILARFDRSRVKSKTKFVLWTGVFPLALVVFAHVALFNDTLIHTDGNLFNALGSVDGFFTDVLGPYFYVIIGLLYAVEIYLLLQDKRKYLLPVLSAGLLIYYVAGYPGYYNILLDYQTYPWLSQQVSDQVRAAGRVGQASDNISVYIPDDFNSQDRVEMYNGLRVRGIDNADVYVLGTHAPEDMQTDLGFIIRKLDGTETSDLKVYEFNGQRFTIEDISR